MDDWEDIGEGQVQQHLAKCRSEDNNDDNYDYVDSLGANWEGAGLATFGQVLVRIMVMVATMMTMMNCREIIDVIMMMMMILMTIAMMMRLSLGHHQYTPFFEYCFCHPHRTANSYSGFISWKSAGKRFHSCQG